MKKTGNSAMTEKNQNIQVFVRCRPLNNQEKKNNFHTPVEVNPDKKEILIKEKPQDKFTKKFTFDKVFGPQAKQVDVYKSVVGPLLEEVLMGYNCTVFAYGQTGTGKTHTMEGERVTDESRPWDEDPGIGIIPRSLKQLFEELQQTDVEYSVRVSFMELYNEELFDLLTSIEDNSKLRLFEDVARKGSVIIQNLEEVVVTCIEDVYSVLQRGSQKRQTAATLMNAHSSRSHSVFSVTVHIKENNIDGEELLKTGKLNLVDLAGSENIGRSGATEKRAREAGNINQSLLTLGRVITALVEKAPHIPYRESKLTRLLQDSLGGRTKTSIIATISPSLCNLEETLSTLDYAHRAKNITNRPEVNQKMTKKALLRAYTEEIDRLRRDLIAAREKNGIFVDEENYNATQMQLVQQTCEIKEKLTWIESLEEEINKKNELIEEIKKELSCKSYRLQVTEETLEKTAEDLLNTQKVLTATTQDRNEQKYLVDEHQQKETMLLNQAEELISVVHKTTSDVNGLHEKIQRKQNVEHQNKNILDEFEQKLNHSVCEIEEKICKFAEMQSNDFNNLHSVIEQETVHTCENISMMKVIMKNLKYQYLMEKEQLINMIRSHELNTQNAMDEHSVKTSKLLERIIEKSINFQQSYIPMIEILLCLVEKSHTSSQCLTEHVLQKVKEAEASNNAFHKKLKENLTEFEQRYQQYYSEITEINEQTKDSLHEVSTYESQEHQKLNVLKQQINEINQTISQFEELKQRKNETQNMLSIYNDQRESLINKEKDFCQQHLENANEHSNKENEHEKVILQSINDEVVEITNLADKTQTETKEHASILLNTMKDFTASLVSNVQEVNGQLVENIAKEIQHCQERSKLVEDKIKVAEVENGIDECSNKMEKTEDDFNEHMNILRSHVNESTHTDTITSILKDTNGIKGTAQSYFETFVDDVPTGKTPQRQTYTYPVKLAKTSPHEKILQKYRSRNELESALNLPLPDDSDLVNDENIKPLNLSLLSDCSEKNETEQKENDSSKELNRSKIPSLSRSRCKNDRRPLRIHNQSN